MFEVKFADIGEGIHEGVLYKIKVEIGDNIEEGQTLFLVETDKVTAEIPSPVDGVLKEIHFEEGDEIEVGQTIVSIDTDQDDSSESDEEEKTSKKEKSDEDEKSSKKEAEKKEKKSSEKESSDEEDKEEKSQKEKSSSKSKEDDDDSASVVGDLEYSSDVIPSSQEGSEASQENKDKVLATPVARKMAKDLKVDIQEVKGTGPGGRVMKEDIKKFADEKDGKESKKSKESKDQKKSEASKDEDKYKKVPMNTMRKTISKHMTKSKFTIPHTAVMDEIVVDSLVAYRNKLKERLQDRDISLTYLPFIIKALTVALKKHEILNASLDESQENILIHKDISIGIAVDTPHGLMVPVIKNADHLSIIELSEKITELSEKAQDKTLSMDEISGSTFTITNYGAFGSSFGVPIINYPNSAIVGIGKITKKPWVVNDKIEIASVLPLSMAFDHRIMDGADVGRFLITFKSLLNDIELLLIS